MAVTDWLVVLRPECGEESVPEGVHPPDRGVCVSVFRPSCQPHDEIRSKTDRSRVTMRDRYVAAGAVPVTIGEGW